MTKNKILALLISIITASNGISMYNNNLEQNDKKENKSLIATDINDKFNNQIIIETTTKQTHPKTTTTTKTTTETIKYSELAFLYQLSNDYSLEQLHDIIIQYSNYSHISYEDAIKLLNDNIEFIKNNETIEAGIVKTLFDNSYLGDYCDQSIIEVRPMTRDEQEQIIINMCKSLNINNDDITIILSIFRWETGHGKSELCVYCNNYGGITVSNGFGKFQTPEYGIYRAIKCIYGHITNSKNQLGNDNTEEIINNMAPIYCPPTATDWANHISSMTYSVKEYYNNFEEVKKISFTSN